MKRSLRSWLRSVPLEQEVDEELAFHREMRARERGKAEVDPHVRGRLVAIARKRDREMRLAQWFEEAWTDVRFALRQMRQALGFTAVAVITLAPRIGVLLCPLPFPHANRPVTANEWGPGPGGRSRVELIDLEEWTRPSRTLEAIAARLGNRRRRRRGADPRRWHG